MPDNDMAIAKLADRCTICDSPADRFGIDGCVYTLERPSSYFRCRANRDHVTLGPTGIFFDRAKMKGA